MAFPVRFPLRRAWVKSALYLSVALPVLASLASLGARAEAPKPKHDWEPKHNLRAPYLKPGKPSKEKLAAGELLSLELVGGQDWDRDLKSG